ncbi:MAG TPA: carbohydrate-binding protein [Bacillota bacterium]
MKNAKVIKTARNKYQQAREEFGSFHLGETVFIEPSIARRGDPIRINYQGLLKNSGADAVYLHYGFDRWNSPQTVAMYPSPEGIFQAEVRANGNYEMNFCFKDSANNWDNNSGQDWSITLQ